MKQTFTFLLIFFSFVTFAKEKEDSTKTGFKVSGSVLLTNNGISPVPAFSLGQPAIMTAVTVKKGGFSYTPQFNYAADAKPWAVNNWLRYQISSGKFTFRTGMDVSFYFARQNIVDNNQTIEVQRVNQYIELEAATIYQFSEKTSFQFIYWNVHGIEYDAVKLGHFVSLSANFSQILHSKTFNFGISPNLFYLKNSIPYEGIFISATGNLTYKKVPFSLFIQGVQPLKVVPIADFNWNYGVIYTF